MKFWTFLIIYWKDAFNFEKQGFKIENFIYIVLWGRLKLIKAVLFTVFMLAKSVNRQVDCVLYSPAHPWSYQGPSEDEHISENYSCKYT